MAENINDGGRAFPVHPGSNPDGGNAGMSLRDWFAGQAMGNLCALAAGEQLNAADAANEVAKAAFKLSDAMLAARSR